MNGRRPSAVGGLCTRKEELRVDAIFAFVFPIKLIQQSHQSPKEKVQEKAKTKDGSRVAFEWKNESCVPGIL